jgi:hypothetical protein
MAQIDNQLPGPIDDLPLSEPCEESWQCAKACKIPAFLVRGFPTQANMLRSRQGAHLTCSQMRSCAVTFSRLLDS